MANSKQIRRDHFNQELQNLLEQKTKSNLFTKEHHDELIREYIDANRKLATTRSPQEIRLLNKFDLLRLEGTKRLVKRGSKFFGTRFFVHSGELFRIFEKAHHELNHASAKKMFDYLRSTYMNITMESITLYIQTCEFCQTKKSLKGFDSRQFSKWLIGFVDMSNSSDGNDVEQVAENLREIFGWLGAPQILGYEGDREFVENVKEKLKEFYNDLKIITGKEEESCQNSEWKNELKKLLTTLCKNRKTDSWAKVIPELQFMLNTIEDHDQCTPYERFFGRKPNFGLNIALPKNFKTEDLIEEKLEQFCRQYLNTNSNSSKKPSTSFNDSAILSDDSDAHVGNSDSDTDESEETFPNLHRSMSVVVCHCKTGCTTKRCSCLAANSKCSSFCHRQEKYCENRTIIDDDE
nr:KRAB-A domain-containing protein 2-like isoform X2 [Dermatophagoides farinae]